MVGTTILLRLVKLMDLRARQYITARDRFMALVDNESGSLFRRKRSLATVQGDVFGMTAKLPGQFQWALIALISDISHTV